MFAINFDAGKNVAFNLTAEQITQLLGHANVHQHIVMIGLKNILQDCHASIVREDFATEDEWIKAKREKAELKLGAMMTGDIRVTRGEKKPTLSAKETFIHNFLRDFVKAADKAAYKAGMEREDAPAWLAAEIAALPDSMKAKAERAWEVEQEAEAEMAAFIAAKKAQADI